VNKGSGSFNTVIGDAAGGDLADGSDNIYIGATAASGVTSESSTIRIGDPAFISACFIGGITGVVVTGDPVCVDGNGQLGVCGTTEKQAAKIALQESQIQALTAALKQQAEQIQKVSAQLEMIRPAPRMVGNR